ncbi:hypothetical protein [Rothia uropygialis]|uniref:hypothetical protein n=1 Tax=Kocuria sp. 36 TaxID=1415402 RepID=UPI00101B9D8D|nr:hypothetical protein [Kocuria sp. 36]
MSQDFFGFDEDDEQTGHYLRRRSKWRWFGVLIILVALILAGLLIYGGVRSLHSAKEDAPYAGHSWVVSGQFLTSTNDLQTKTFNGVYQGKLPSDSNVSYQRFDGGVNDPTDVKPGQQVQFRGTQTGAQDEDFPQNVDALMAVDNGVLKVVKTDDAGTLKPVTDDSVSAEKRNGWLMVAGAIVVFLAGIAGAIFARHKTREDELHEQINA